MKTTFDGTYCIAPKDATPLNEQNGYGRIMPNGRLRLEPCEALYLEARGRIDLEGETFATLLCACCTKNPSFLRNFIVYRDIRERGLVIIPGQTTEGTDTHKTRPIYRIFPRGMRPGKGTSRHLMQILSERDPIDYTALIRDAKKAANMRKQLILAVLDDEHELTYYEVRLPILPPRKTQDIPAGISAHLTGLPAYVTGDCIEELQKNWFGTMMDATRLYLSPLETAWLLRNGYLTLDVGLTADEYESRAASADNEFSGKLKLFTYFKSLGYYPRSGYKYGHHFRVYTDSTTHSEILANAVFENSISPMQEISRSVRLAHSVKKRMLFMSISNDEIIPIEFARIKL